MKAEIKFFCKACNARNIEIRMDPNPFALTLFVCQNCGTGSQSHKVTSIVEIKPENANYVLSQEAQDELDALEELFKNTQAETLAHMQEYVETNHPSVKAIWSSGSKVVKDVKYIATLRQPCMCAEWEPFYTCYKSGKDFVEPRCKSCDCSISTELEDILDLDFKPLFGCISCDAILYDLQEGEILLCHACDQCYTKVNNWFNSSAQYAMDHKLPLQGQILRRVDVLNGVNYEDPSVSREIVAEVKNANIITSEVAGTFDHKPVLDIDLGCKLIPSTHAGHYHLYIDKQMSWDKYKKLLEALKEGGIIEPGYFQAALARKYTGVRLPWIRKKDSNE